MTSDGSGAKTLLVVAYDYPPSANVGSVRPSKFVKFLPEFGWMPLTLTVACSSAARSGLSPVARVREMPHPIKLYRRVMERRDRIRALSGESAVPKLPAPPLDLTRTQKAGLWLKQCALDTLSFPDEEVGWVLPAILRGARLIRQHRISHVLTTSPPFSTHLVGLGLQGLTGVRWVADFRDPWPFPPKLAALGNRVTHGAEAWVSRRVMSRADAVVSVTDPMTQRLRDKYPELDAHKFSTITNGFDPADFVACAQGRPRSGPIVFSYLGEFYFGRTPQPFLRALRSLIDEGAIPRGDIRVQFMGNVEMAEGQPVSTMVSGLGLDDVVTVSAAVPRTQALKVAMQSDVLLVLTEAHSYALPFKVFEALASGAIILNIGSGGAVSQLLATTGRGVAANHESAAEIRNAILESVARARQARVAPNDEPWREPVIQPYDFRSLAASLSALLDGLA